MPLIIKNKEAFISSFPTELFDSTIQDISDSISLALRQAIFQAINIHYKQGIAGMLIEQSRK